jgi:hypothetical protein
VLGRVARLDQRPDVLDERAQLGQVEVDVRQTQVALKGGEEVRLGHGAGS